MNNNVGSVNIIRDRQFKGSLITFEIYIDNQLAGSVDSGQTLNVPVYYGNHVVSIKTIDKTVDLQVLLSDTQRNFYVQVNCKMGFITGRPNVINSYYG